MTRSGETQNRTDVELIRHALAYAIELYRELTGENGAPTLGTQNQVVDFILADPEIREAVARWGRTVDTDEAATRPPQRLPYDDAYRRIRDFAQSRMEQPVFMRPGQEPGRSAMIVVGWRLYRIGTRFRHPQ